MPRKSEKGEDHRPSECLAANKIVVSLAYTCVCAYTCVYAGPVRCE